MKVDENKFINKSAFISLTWNAKKKRSLANSLGQDNQDVLSLHEILIHRSERGNIRHSLTHFKMDLSNL